MKVYILIDQSDDVDEIYKVVDSLEKAEAEQEECEFLDIQEWEVE